MTTDTFNRADSTSSLGTTSDGTASWTTQIGTLGISTNQAYSSALDGTIGYSAATVPGAADCTVTGTVSAAAGAGIIFRASSGTSFWMFIQTSATIARVYTANGTNITQISTNITVALGDTLSIDASGTTITAKVNGTTQSTLTGQTLFQTATGAGVYFQSTTARLDNFSVTFAAPPAYRSPAITVRAGAVRRASVI